MRHGVDGRAKARQRQAICPHVQREQILPPMQWTHRLPPRPAQRPNLHPPFQRLDQRANSRPSTAKERGVNVPFTTKSKQKRAPLPKNGESDTLILHELVIALAKQQARQDHKKAMQNETSRSLR